MSERAIFWKPPAEKMQCQIMLLLVTITSSNHVSLNCVHNYGRFRFKAPNAKFQNINKLFFEKPLRLKGGALDIQGYHPAPLQRCREWLEATTFDSSPVQSAFEGGWGNPMNSSLETRLWMAAEMGDGRAIQNLVAFGVSINAANGCNQTALHKAAQSA